ncbi:hypothetical protein Patl1_10680 [Pistacia atlantica]|uniref:Uncharacterized protein n=1 Tax=Pistacia atlantica TaxID=434234 RepID=A0ACC1A415_9ROSI|nr:hypothetical protein Patl1_10680 [Pistacia atlantica]
MGFKLSLIFLLSAVLMMVQSTAFDEEMYGDKNMMESWSGRRQLEDSETISYAALPADKVPINNRGISYYNCETGLLILTAMHGCSSITDCASTLFT